MIKRILAAALTVGLLAVVGYGTYTQLYLPSQHALLTGEPPVRPGNVGQFAAHPLTDAEQQTFGVALRDAVAALQPRHCAVTEQLYVKRDGYAWVVVRKLSSQYFDEYGFALSEDSRATFDGQTVDYLIWRPNWLHSLFDDREVAVVALREPRIDSATMVFGYFELRACP